MASFYWHDYETWGARPAIDRPCQFAGVRTNMDLEIIEDPLVIYCRPPEDVLPHPEACLITGITPQKAQRDGLSERDFVSRIHAAFSQPDTCALGYNSLRFDDEVTRYTLYRNFFDPYEREWKHGCSRWDIIDMVRFCYALRPDGINWPLREDGSPSFKLEALTQANGISHSAAHDAFSDVEATIALAKLIKEKKSQLYHYVLNNKSKQAAQGFIDLKQRKPLLHVSSMFSAQRGCAALVAPIAMHPSNKNAVIAIDLSYEPSALKSMSSEALRAGIFASREDVEAGATRIPIKLIHLNKCPILATPKLVDTAVEERLGLDKSTCEANWQTLRTLDIAGPLREIFAEQHFEQSRDPEQQLYDGFVPEQDKKIMQELRLADTNTLRNATFLFRDARLNAMLLFYKARNFPQSLNSDELGQWQEHVRERLAAGGEGAISSTQCLQTINQLLPDIEAQQKEILKQIELYISALQIKYELKT